MTDRDTQHFSAEVRYDASPARTYEALASPGGDNGWWTTDGDVVSGPGRLLRLNWSPSDYVVFRVDVADAPRELRWTCVAQHDASLPRPDEWLDTTLVFVLAPDGAGTLARFEHIGLAPALDCYDACAGGWDFFLRRSVRQLVELGRGIPFQAATERGDAALDVVRAYHDGWSSRDFDRAGALLADDLAVETPINEYPTKASFVQALTGFGSMTRAVDVLSEMSHGDQAMLLYDMDVHGLGRLRVAEHFTVADGRITRVRQIHDTAPIREAGLAARP